jgi:hypothetical protein
MNCCRETTRMGMGVPPCNRPTVPRDWFQGVPKWYVAGADTRGRQEGRPYPWSQQVIHEISWLGTHKPTVELNTKSSQRLLFSLTVNLWSNY